MSRNDFSINLWDELEKWSDDQVEQIDETKISTFQVDIWEPIKKSQEQEQVSLPQESWVEKPMSKKEAKAAEEKKIMEDNAINILSEITSNWINVDQMPDEIQLEMFKKSQDSRKKRKMIFIWMWVVFFVIALAGLWYYVVTNKQQLAAMIIKPKADTLWVNNSATANCSSTNTPALVEVKDFYQLYLSDFNYIKSLNLPVDQKDNYLKRINLLVWSYNNKSINYKDFRIQYNQIITEVLSK